MTAHLNGAIVSNESLFHGLIPEAPLSEVFEQVMIDYLELPREDTTRVDVAGVRLKGFVVAQDLSS